MALEPVFADVPATGFRTGTFPWGQCTYWAAYNWGGPAHRGVTWSGDAWQWVANAAAQGIAATNSPSVGAIAVYMRGTGYDGAFGHVAVVTAVTSTSYTISEMNYIGLGAVDTRTISLPDAHVMGFIPP
jgi:surface antigen